jgi:hypothetical protein
MSDVSLHKQPPEEALKRLAAIDPRLSLRWVDGAIAYWAITERWVSDDPRRERIKLGELPSNADWDVKAFLPPNCSPYEIEGYIAQRWERVTDPKKQADEAVENVKKENIKQQDALREAFADEQGEKGKRTTKHDIEVQAGMATANAQIIVPAQIGKEKRK